jgi:hypothetical protein
MQVVLDMKTHLPVIMILCLSGSLSLGLLPASAEMEVSVGVSIQAPADFYAPLTPQGAWVDVGSYGHCWRPAGVAAGWRPYCNGSWEWTDCGWYWVSDEPWAWACYHYGSWAYDSNDGWVWVPGVEWAPAWVNWRTGGDYVGWVPCGPPGFTIEPSFYVFVENRHFNDQIRPGTVIVNNQSIINSTTEMRSARRENRQFNGKSQMVVVNEGPRVDAMEKATGHKFTAVSVQEADRRTAVSVSKTLKQRAAEPAPGDNSRTIQEQPKPAPGENRETPNNVTPKQEVPAEKALPPDRAVPQTPSDRIVPPANKELPQDKEQRRPNGVVPPLQPLHPSTPAVPPGNQVPKAGGQNQDKDKDRGNNNP